MKKLILIIAAVAISHSIVFSQGCLPEGIYFTTQAQIDSFPINYPECTEIVGNVIICDYGTGNISNLNGLIALTSIGGNLSIISSALINLTELNNLNTIGGSLVFGDPCQGWGNNSLLTSLTGLEGLTSIGGGIGIHGNSSLTSLTGLENVTSIGENLFISYNNVLASLTVLDNLTSIGGDILIEGNSALTSLTGLEGVTSIEGDLAIKNNNSLASLSGLEGVISIEGNLVIDYNNSLASLTGLEGLTSITGNLIISSEYPGIPVLTSLAGLENLTSIGGTLEIYGMYSMTSLTGLENLTSLGGGLEITSAPLISLMELENLTSIGGNLHIAATALINMTGLEYLTSIGGELYICANEALSSFNGLENIAAGSITGLYINNNISLTNCNIQNICDYLATPGGSIEINWNAPGCNSQAEVEEACQVGLENTSEKCIFNIYPNPSTEQLTVEFYLKQPCMVNLVVHNSLGQVVATLADRVLASGPHQVFWNSGNLPAGIYFFRLQIGNNLITKKIVKIY